MVHERQFLVKCEFCKENCCLFCLASESLFKNHGDMLHHTRCPIYKKFPLMKITNINCP